MSTVLADLRREYTLNGFDVADVLPDPVPQFTRWFEAALQAGVPEPNAMHLSTVSADGRPAGRIVLLKELSEGGFVFYTNYTSRKGSELTGQPVAALTFFWPELERQVRIEGHVGKVSDEESDAYFRVRPRGSQIGAWVSHQSEVIAGRQVLEDNWRELEGRFAGQDVPRPPHWGGFRLMPDTVEFWQGRPSRLHDRIRYRLDGEARWVIERLAP
ncbi:pyridoxamine 5'-phosphate oxidase [Nibrella saemangeumensis]|uniref:Pyridoxine/pyridoxamine 5'-phosphate oxidase n=1 Tax=Nibrella saemangeumensis TaxID=1084526 RepID=A0ABP8MTU4_9BACT